MLAWQEHAVEQRKALMLLKPFQKRFKPYVTCFPAFFTVLKTGLGRQKQV